jgi:hypothetical protein
MFRLTVCAYNTATDTLAYTFKRVCTNHELGPILEGFVVTGVRLHVYIETADGTGTACNPSRAAAAAEIPVAGVNP